MLLKAVIPAAGLGTRLLPVTKAQPKEMLPIFSRRFNGKICVKPLLQLVFENLFDLGIRQFCFIVGPGKRAIEDHFTPDNEYMILLDQNGKNDLSLELKEFYTKLQDSIVYFVNQPEPRGTGDALFRSKEFTGSQPFLYHAGDTFIISHLKEHPIKRLVRIFEEQGADVAFLVEESNEPEKYGVIDADQLCEDIYVVKDIVEKPANPPSNLAVIAVYVFTSSIFEALARTLTSQIQLTEAIQYLVRMDKKVLAIKLRYGEKRLDIGTPETYEKALNLSLSNAKGSN